MDASEQAIILQAIASAGSTRAAAHILGCSHRTLIRRMHALGIPVAPRGRPRLALRLMRTASLMTPEEATRSEGAYWRARAFEDRISAVEALREPTLASSRAEVDRRLVRLFAAGRTKDLLDIALLEEGGRVSKPRRRRTKRPRLVPK
jgi:hypothetical protein